MWWFTTNLPVHVVQLLKLTGFKKNDTKFWASDTPIAFWTKADLDAWKMTNVPAWLDELSSCPGCLSMHISFWVATACTIAGGIPNILFFCLAWFGWPYISNVALALLKKINKS